MTKKIININSKRKPDKNAVKILLLSDAIDYTIKKSIQNDVEPKIVAGILANRLGRFISRFNKKELLWEKLVRIIKREAKLK